MNAERIVLYAPAALAEAVDIAAHRKMGSRSEYARAALLAALRADGIDPVQPTRQWALTRDSVVLEDDRGNPEVSPMLSAAPAPGEWGAHRHPMTAVWLPVENADDREFDPRKHWRAAPRYVVSGDKVLRLYQVIDKTMGGA
jgi:hypothetical protein